jgi:hypothetical protein
MQADRARSNLAKPILFFTNKSSLRAVVMPVPMLYCMYPFKRSDRYNKSSYACVSIIIDHLNMEWSHFP